MRSFYFTSRIIGQERYLTYTMGAETELDEDVLDYCEENLPGELLPIIYEEDDDYDYLTYDVSSRVSLEDFMQHEMTQAGVLTLLKNIAQGLISVKEQAIHLSYILLNKSFVFVDENDLSISFICLPVESKAALSVEFKSFVRQILAYIRYDVEEDLNYVGKLLTYINGDNFNLRGLIGLTEALMEEAGIDFEEEETTSDDGIEIVNLGPAEEPSGDGVTDFMSGGNAEDVPLPEIGDDEEEGAEAESEAEEEESADALFAGMTGVLKQKAEEAEAARRAAEAQEASAEGKQVEAEASETEESEAEAEAAPGDSEVLRERTKNAMVDKIKQKMVGSSVKFEEAKKDEDEASEAKEAAPAKEETNKSGLKGITGIGGGAPKIVHPLPIEGLTTGPTISMKKTIKVNRAAMIQSHAAEATTDGEAAAEEEQATAAAAPATAPAAAETPAAPAAEPATPAAAETPAAPAPEEPEVKKTKAKTVTPPKALPYLIRVSTKEIIMLNKPQFKLGKASRGVDFSISGNGAVSRQHAVIIQKDGEVFIKDNKSTNHTFVNGKQIEEGVEVPLTHDADIMLGDEEFKFKIR